MNTFITTQPLVDQLCGSRLGSINWEKNVVPDLAERWDISKDSQTYTFYLRKGLKWDDGQPLTAEDVEWTYTMGLNPKTASWVGGQFSDVAGSDEYAKGTAKTVSGIKVIDPLTIQIQLKQPSGVWLFRECFLTVLPKHILGSTAPEDLAKHSFWSEKRVGSGPFKFVKYTTQQTVEFAANEGYHFGKPYIDRVLAHLYADAQTAQLAFEKGEVDSCSVSIPELERFQRLPHSTIVRLPNGTCRFLAANTTKPEFADKRFRQAVAYAIDRPTITKALFKDMFIPIYGPFVQSWAKNPDDNQYPYNPEKAKALLREIGWNASRVVEIVYYYTDAISKSLMETIQQMLVAVGVKTSLRLVPDDPPWEKEVYNEATYDLAFAAQGVPLDPDQATALIDSRKIYPNGVNYSRYKNPRVDQLLDAGRAAAVQSERQKIYQEIDKILNEDLPYIWLWEPAAVTAINKRVVGMAERQAALPNTPPLNEIHKWWIAS